MTSTLLEETAAAPKKPAPVLLRSSHDYAITTQALESREEELKKLAKKNLDEGYSREARAIQADADAIEHQILPAFREQRELPLVTSEQLEKEVGSALRTFIFRAFEGLGDPKVIVSPGAIADRREQLLKSLAKRVTIFATDLADESFNQGVAAREHTAESLALRTIGSLRASGE